MPPWLLLIDPTDLIFDGLTNEFSQRFDVIVVDDEVGAQEAIDDEGTPHVVAIAFEQGEVDGMAVAKRLRKRLGPECLVVVYGLPPVGHAMRDGALRRLEKKHQVDLFAHSPFSDGYLLGQAIWTHVLDEQFLAKSKEYEAPSWLLQLQAHEHLSPTLARLLPATRQVTRREDAEPVRTSVIEKAQEEHASAHYRRQRGEADMDDILDSPLTANNLRMFWRKVQGNRIMRKELND